jgi:hypothetical protein
MRNPNPIDALFSDEDRARADMLDRQLRGIGIGGGHYARDGTPITFGQWTVLFERFEAYRIVRQTWTHSGAWISTVWMGLDHAFGSRYRAPLIFETMAFHEGEDLECDRYTTEAEAIAGHEAIVERYGGRDHDGSK